MEAPFEGVSWEDTYLFEVVRLSVHRGAWTENQLLQFFSHEVPYCRCPISFPRLDDSDQSSHA